MPVSSGVVHGWVTSVIVASWAGPDRLGPVAGNGSARPAVLDDTEPILSLETVP